MTKKLERITCPCCGAIYDPETRTAEIPAGTLAAKMSAANKRKAAAKPAKPKQEREKTNDETTGNKGGGFRFFRE